MRREKEVKYEFERRRREIEADFAGTEAETPRIKRIQELLKNKRIQIEVIVSVALLLPEPRMAGVSVGSSRCACYHR